jgi:hypothetical protein
MNVERWYIIDPDFLTGYTGMIKDARKWKDNMESFCGDWCIFQIVPEPDFFSGFCLNDKACHRNLF